MSSNDNNDDDNNDDEQLNTSNALKMTIYLIIGLIILVAIAGTLHVCGKMVSSGKDIIQTNVINPMKEAMPTLESDHILTLILVIFVVIIYIIIKAGAT